MKQARFSYEFIADACRAELLGNASGGVESISSDSRSIKKGEAFLALVGENHNGHDFLLDAKSKGVKAFIISDGAAYAKLSMNDDSVTGFLVEDTLKAFGDIAAAWKAEKAPFTFAVTGSNGKTTTKEMIASIMRVSHSVLKTDGNFNNLIGLPITLMRLTDEAMAVLEMGMSDPGEIARLSEIAQPDIGVITNVAAAHLESMGSVEAIAKAKGELFEHLTKERIAVVNLDNEHTKAMLDWLCAKPVTFSLHDGNADIIVLRHRMSAHGIEASVSVCGEVIQVAMPLLGAHNVSNMAAAIAAAYAAGISLDDIVEGLRSVSLPGGRVRSETIGDYFVIDDSYNANPASMKAALALFQSMHEKRKRRIAMLGDMLELGVDSERFHREIGEHAFNTGVSLLVSFGQYADAIRKGARSAGMSESACYAFDEFDDLKAWIEKEAKAGDAFLIKGSRSMRMERVTDLLRWISEQKSSD